MSIDCLQLPQSYALRYPDIIRSESGVEFLDPVVALTGHGLIHVCKDPDNRLQASRKSGLRPGFRASSLHLWHALENGTLRADAGADHSVQDWKPASEDPAQWWVLWLLVKYSLTIP